MRAFVQSSPVGVAPGAEAKSERKPREFFGGACVVEARPIQTGASVPMPPMPRAMPHQSTPGFSFWRDGFVVVNGRKALRATGVSETAETRGFATSGRKRVHAQAGRNSREHGWRDTSYSVIAGTGRPATTTKPSLRPVALRHTSHAPASGHRKKDRAAFDTGTKETRAPQGACSVRPPQGSRRTTHQRLMRVVGTYQRS